MDNYSRYPYSLQKYEDIFGDKCLLITPAAVVVHKQGPCGVKGCRFDEQHPDGSAEVGIVVFQSWKCDFHEDEN